MTIKLGLVGTGTVGGGCIDILHNHREDFKRRLGVDMELVRVCSRNPEQAEAHGVSDLFTTDFNDILNDPEIDIVIELIGGTTVARDIVLGALNAGKNVVTANKALMATYGEEVMGLAREKNLEVGFEASVGGGIPIIQPLKHSLISNEITSVMGIVNGTTNYMLSRMVDDGLSYDDALAEAQAKGFAEADPTADVDGFDAAAKIAILATIGFNTRVTMDDVSLIEGIRGVSPVDVACARGWGYRVKLLAVARSTASGVDVRVHPAMLPVGHQLASVDGVFNAVYVVGDAVGETMYFGPGAGDFPTASAVMGDVLALATPLAHGSKPLAEAKPFDRVLPVCNPLDLTARYYVRLALEDRPGILGPVASVFGDEGVSIALVSQPSHDENAAASLVLLTQPAQERAVQAALAKVREVEGVQEVCSVIRVEDTEAWKAGKLAR